MWDTTDFDRAWHWRKLTPTAGAVRTPIAVGQTGASFLRHLPSPLRHAPKMTMTTSNNPAADSPVIVLVTANPQETEALLEAFVGRGSSPTPVTKGGVTYFDLGVHSGQHIVHTRCEAGAGASG